MRARGLLTTVCRAIAANLVSTSKMGKSVWVLAALVGAVSSAVAQAPQWVRLSLNDGRYVDGYITGSDAVNYFVQTSYGYFSILRTNVVAVTPMQQPQAPQPQYAPQPQPYQQPYAPQPAPMVPQAEGESDSKAMGRMAGIFYFGVTYGVTAMIASAKVDDDSSAKAGYIPIAGPMIWAFSDDEDDVGEDGWDWLAIGGTLIQASGVYMILTGDTGKSKKKVNVSAITTKSYSGLVVGGTF